MENIENKDKILLSDFLSTALRFKLDPTDTNQKQLNDTLQSFKIKSYMSLADKKILAASIIASITVYEDEDCVTYSSALEASKIMYGLLGYVYNLENDLAGTLGFDSCYDVLCELGIIDYILPFCEKDYKRLEKLIDDCINYTNISQLMSLAEYLDGDNLDKFIEAIKLAKKELTPEMLKDMKSILNAEDPKWQALKETVGDEAMDAISGHPAEKSLDESIKAHDESKNNQN